MKDWGIVQPGLVFPSLSLLLWACMGQYSKKWLLAAALYPKDQYLNGEKCLIQTEYGVTSVG